MIILEENVSVSLNVYYFTISFRPFRSYFDLQFYENEVMDKIFEDGINIIY